MSCQVESIAQATCNYTIWEMHNVFIKLCQSVLFCSGILTFLLVSEFGCSMQQASNRNLVANAFKWKFELALKHQFRPMLKLANQKHPYFIM